MPIFKKDSAVLDVDFNKRSVTSLILNDQELVAALAPLFTLSLLDNSGKQQIITAFDAAYCEETSTSAKYSGFPIDISVTVSVSDSALASWTISVNNRTDLLIEYVEFPNITLKPLKKNGGSGEILFPYNEGALIDDAELHSSGIFPHCEFKYPSRGNYAMFPNMICSQFMCYMQNGSGVYLAAHDEKRTVKGIDFFMIDGGVRMQFCTFCGVDFGADFISNFSFVWDVFDGDWHDGAELYRTWFENNLPTNTVKVAERTDLPDWYEDSPLVISYPVRGVHDMDKMDPNALFPYSNALPLVDEISKTTKSKLLVLLMHWEGTAPWAPPYVWPPYGGEDCFNDFADTLHKDGHLLGVYCSGFGFTKQSNLIAEYNCEKQFEDEYLEEAMCQAPDHTVGISAICTGQRSGYDLCVMADKAKKVLADAYTPLFKSKIDYAQILDQNHGGGQYFCYAKDHGHPPAPGQWMTDSMTELLSSWNDAAPGKLFGCESAAAEPYIPYLKLSDNRFELNWWLGKPVPMYSYIYHEYIRNFMGNQVCCGLSHKCDTMCFRMAYSFIAGDCMTLVLTPWGELMSNWGCHDFSHLPNKENVLTFAANMRRFYEFSAKPFLYCGKMIKPEDYSCSTVAFPAADEKRTIESPSVLSSAWESGGISCQIFVNHTASPQEIIFRGNTHVIPSFDAIML